MKKKNLISHSYKAFFLEIKKFFTLRGERKMKTIFLLYFLSLSFFLSLSHFIIFLTRKSICDLWDRHREGEIESWFKKLKTKLLLIFFILSNFLLFNDLFLAYNFFRFHLYNIKTLFSLWVCVCAFLCIYTGRGKDCKARN